MIADLKRTDQESTQAHQAFLLWAMQAPDQRSARAAGRAIGKGDSTIRLWKAKHDWDKRVGDEYSDRHAATLYAELYHRVHGGKEVALVVGRMSQPYVPPVAKDMTEVAKATDLHLDIARENERSDRRERLQIILDAAEVRIAEGLESGALKPKVSDLSHIVRARAAMEVLYGKPDVLSEGSSGPIGDRIERSERVRQVRVNKPGDEGALIEALHEDWQDMGVVLDVLREQSASDAEAEPDNVIAMEPGAK